MSNGADFTLIVLGGSLTALAVGRNAADLGCCAVIICASGEPALSSSSFAQTYEVDSEQQVLSTIEQHHYTTERIALLPTSDNWVRYTVKFRRELEKHGVLVLQAQDEAINCCLDKSKFDAWARQCDLPVPDQIELSSAAGTRSLRKLADLPYPLIIRPTQSVHGNNTDEIDKARFAHDSEELSNVLELYDQSGSTPVATQSLLPFQPIQYSVGIVRANGEMRSFVAEKVRPTAECAAVGSYVRMTDAPDVEALARSAVEKLDFFGIAEVEILKRSDNNQLYLIEINARPWLQYNIAWRSGHDFLRFLLARDTYEPEREIKRGFAWIDFNSDFFTAFSSSIGLVRHGKVSLASYLSSLARSNVYARFSWRDRRPFYVGLKELFRLVIGRAE